MKINKHYYIFNDTRSWEGASQLCRETAGFLPYFTSREELAELVAMIKLSEDIPVIEAIYIGLKLKGDKEVNNSSVNYQDNMVLGMFDLTVFIAIWFWNSATQNLLFYV